MTILKDGSHTRFNRSATKESCETGGLSCPEVSLCGTAWESLISWSTMEQIGSSEHLPIAICINKRKQMGIIYKGQPRYKSSEVNWKAYTEAIENSWNSGKTLKNYQRKFKR